MLNYAARMPVTEVVEFAQELDWVDAPGRRGQAAPGWLRTREAAALIAATAGRAASDFEAVLRALLHRPQPAAANLRSATVDLLSVITAYPSDVIVKTSMGLNAVAPDLLSAFVRIAATVLPEILVRGGHRGDSRLLSTYGPLLSAAGTHLPSDSLCDFYLDLRERALLDEASFLLTQAAANPDARHIISALKGRGLRREAKQLSQAARDQHR